ncbi:hypothetical protein ABW20_dc0105338 [Dactylellina cionopaga]|nr:hypothetical protein ABW20_dc0105338 [Dactylellina cionopaga]
MSFVEQDPVLFSGTIKENILHGLPDAHKMSTTEQATLCIEAATLANAREFIEAQPSGYDTVVGPDGASQLSGGQVARVALARALVVAESVLFGFIISCLRGEPPEHGPQDPNFYCLMFFVVGAVALIAYTSSGACFGIVSERLVQRLRDLCFQKIMEQDLSFFADPEHCETALVASIQSDTAALTSLSGVMIGTIVSVTTTLVGGIVIAHVVAWKIAVVLLPALPVIVLAGYLRLRVLMKAQMKQETTYVKAASMATEAANAIRTVASLVREDGVMREYKAELSKAEKGHTKFILQGSGIMALALSIGFFVYALAYWWGAKQVRSGEYSIVEFFIVLPALLFSAQMAGQVFSLAPEFTKAAAASRRIFQLLDTQPLISASSDVNTPTPPSPPSPSISVSEKKPSRTDKGSIHFKNVTFSYPSRPDVVVLRDLSLIVRPGEFVAIVGDSGSGKSSFLSLLQRFYDPAYGTVSVDNQDISKLLVSQHRSRISILSQDLTLFSESIFFNIAVGAGENVSAVNKETVEAVCKKVGIHDFIMTLTEGYNTRCGRNGSCLSGGQIQRVALARALIRDPEILILDEPTSALDVHNEGMVMNAILESCASGLELRRTVVMVAHRLGTVVGADRIVVLRKGRIVEMGHHEELMELGGIYAGMAVQQGL